MDPEDIFSVWAFIKIMACMRPLHSKSIPWWPFTALPNLLARIIYKSPRWPRMIVWCRPEGHGTRQGTLEQAGLERGHQVTPRPLITQTQLEAQRWNAVMAPWQAFHARFIHTLWIVPSWPEGLVMNSQLFLFASCLGAMDYSRVLFMGL